MEPHLTVCYFGIYPPVIARNKVYVDGMRMNGIKVIECFDSSSGFKKFKRLFSKHRVIKNDYDFLFVGYLSNILVPLAKMISSKPVIYNALCSMYEGIIVDRERNPFFSLKAWYYWFMDFMAFQFADSILVESHAQKDFIRKKFYIRPAKIVVMYTGADDEVFYREENILKKDDFTLACRGEFLPASGTKYIIEAAKILKSLPIKFYLYGRGFLEKDLQKLIKDYELTNIEIVNEFLSSGILRRNLLSYHVLLGQFGSHPRLGRTIQNKVFETLALGMPFITVYSKSNSEILVDNWNCLFVKTNKPEELSEKIITLMNDSLLREKLSKNARQSYLENFSPLKIGEWLGGFLLAYSTESENRSQSVNYMKLG